APPPRRLAQRPGRQQEPVAEAATVDDCNLDVAREGVVLQAVVEHEHVRVRMLRAQPGNRFDAVGSDPDRAAAAAREQHRLPPPPRRGRSDPPLAYGTWR